MIKINLPFIIICVTTYQFFFIVGRDALQPNMGNMLALHMVLKPCESPPKQLMVILYMV